MTIAFQLFFPTWPIPIFCLHCKLTWFLWLCITIRFWCLLDAFFIAWKTKVAQQIYCWKISRITFRQLYCNTQTAAYRCKWKYSHRFKQRGNEKRIIMLDTSTSVSSQQLKQVQHVQSFQFCGKASLGNQCLFHLLKRQNHC